MKIYLNKPKSNWISPYDIIEKVIFWKEIDRYKYDKISDFLMPFCEGLKKFLDIINPEINYVKIDRWDAWCFNTTLSPIILPMLKQLKKDKQGYGYIKTEDAPEYLSPYVEDEHGWDHMAQYRYEWLLDELIWTFEQLQPNNDWESQYWPRVDTENCTVNLDGYKAHGTRIQNGLILFGKYYMTFWD